MWTDLKNKYKNNIRYVKLTNKLSFKIDIP